jgi:WD40 repeat protein
MGGLVTAVSWMDDGRLVTASSDGSVRTVSPDFANIRSWQLGAPVHYMSTSRDSIYAATTDGTIWDVSLSTGIEHRISLGTSLTAFAKTPSPGYLAAGSDDGELFIVDDRHRVTAKRFERDIIGCAAFEDDHTLLFCAPGGRILRLELGLQQFGSEL